MPSDPRVSVQFTGKQHAQGGDLPPVTPAGPEPEAKILQLGRPAEPPASAAGVELVTVLAYGGIPLRRMIAVVDEHGEVLLHSPQADSEEELLARWRRACEVMAEAFDDESASYFLRNRRVDEQGRDLPGPS